MSGFEPIGVLPPRRDEVIVEAAAAEPVARLSGGGDSIIVEKAQDRLLELFEREQLPGDVRQSLAGALTGDLRAQQLLFQAMIDTWPRLQKALREVKLAARKAPWQVVPWSERGEDPEESAEKLAKEIEGAVWSMRPDMARGYKGFEGTIEALVEGYFLGHQVCEVHWERKAKGWRPKSTKTLPPRFYGYPYAGDEEDRLMLDREGGAYGQRFEDFPEHRFLVAINGGHPGHSTVAAPLRALSGFWLAAVYGLKWFLQFSQLYGIPFRWAEYADAGDKDAVSKMLANIRFCWLGCVQSRHEAELPRCGEGGDGLASAGVGEDGGRAVRRLHARADSDELGGG